MVNVFKLFRIAFIFTLMYKAVFLLFKLTWLTIYWLCLYPLYIAFYIGFFPLIWIVKKVF